MGRRPQQIRGLERIGKYLLCRNGKLRYVSFIIIITIIIIFLIFLQSHPSVRPTAVAFDDNQIGAYETV